MNNYTAFLFGGIKSPSGDARADGNNLADQCLKKLESAGDKKQFPPKLLILLVSPAYLNLQSARQLLAGIREVFEAAGHDQIKLVGTSVAAVFFEHEIHNNGALLVCLASRMLKVKTGAGKFASQSPTAAVSRLLSELGLDNQGEDLNPMSDRMLLTFFTDIGLSGNGSTAYPSDELHNLLRKSTLHRIPIAGGVSSGHRRYGVEGPALQFCGWDVYTDALVAAQIDSGVPLGVSLCRGVKPLENERGIVRLRVKRLSEDGTFIEELENSRGELWKNGNGSLLLSKDTHERDFIIAKSEQSGGGRFSVLEKVSKGDTLQVRQPQPEMLLKMAPDIFDQANKRVHVKNPIACLSLICSSHFRNSLGIGLNIKQAITNIERKFHTCVGGFVDGEAGVDDTGRSQFGNLSIVGIGFGDEMRDSTPLHLGFKALSTYSPRLTETTKLDEAIEESLNLIFETGFPGAMISFPLLDQNQSCIIGMGAIGARFNKIVQEMRRPLDGKDALANIIRDKKPRFIPDTREASDCDPAEKAVLVSQYIIPLRGPGDDIIAVLQIDLGKIDDLSDSQREVLNSLGAAVGAGINRILNWEVVKVTGKLDEALQASLKAETLSKGLQSFIEATTRAFGASMGHVRIAKPKERRLALAAGFGDYYKAALLCRSEIDFDDGSPTCEAYSSSEITIVNDAPNNPAHRRLREKSQGTPLEEPLKRVGSYANTAFTAFHGQGTDSIGTINADSIGTINLVSEKPWFFTSQHQHLLKALRERVGFLVEHLKQKEKKAEANRRLDFRLKANTQLNQVRDFDDMPAALREATKRFRKAANAHAAALYIWDEQVGKFILRVESGQSKTGWSESGWSESAWVNAARYRKGEGWIGKLGSESPQDYEPNTEKEHYDPQIFVDEHGEGLTISAIGMPLTVRDKCLGVFALYRQETPGDAAGFTDTDTADLRESADSMAALLSILLSRQQTLFSESLQEHFKKISEIFLRDDKLSMLEESLCKEIVAMFGAASADFYFYGDATAPTSVTRYSPLGTWRASERQGPDRLIREVRVGGKHEVVLWKISDEERADPAQAATEGRATRLCIPVFVEQKTAGVLDVRWDNTQQRSSWEIIRHSDRQLRILGTVIGSAYNRYKLAAGQEEERRGKEKEQRKLDVMNKLLWQSAHNFSNLLAELGGMLDRIRGVDAEGREDLARGIAECLKEGEEMVDLPIGFFEKGENLDPEPHYLKPLVKDVLAKSKAAKMGKRVKEEISIEDSAVVNINYECTRQAFTNIINNAIEAARMRERDCMLKISAVSDEKKSQVGIVFQDFSGGISPEKIEAAKNGQVRTPGHKGWGVLIATGLVCLQDGTFDIESDGKTWTKVLVTLPLGQMEEN
jgi:signal transduction histidine kinase/GAF domain-containing protein